MSNCTTRFARIWPIALKISNVWGRIVIIPLEPAPEAPIFPRYIAHSFRPSTLFIFHFSPAAEAWPTRAAPWGATLFFLLRFFWWKKGTAGERAIVSLGCGGRTQKGGVDPLRIRSAWSHICKVAKISVENPNSRIRQKKVIARIMTSHTAKTNGTLREGDDITWTRYVGKLELCCSRRMKLYIRYQLHSLQSTLRLLSSNDRFLAWVGTE